MSTRRNLVALCGAAVLALLATGSETHAAKGAAARLKSSVPMVLDDTVVDDETGQDVILFGLFHVQTTMYPSDSTVTIHANVAGEFVAYSPPKPTSEFGERLNALLAQARGLKDQMPDVLREIAELEGQIEELRQELDGELNPFERKRLQEEIARRRRLQIAAQAELERLRQELADVQQKIQSVLAEIQDEERQAQYVVEGADKVEHMIVTQDGSVGAFVRFELVRADARRTGLDVLLNLQFSAAGLLVSGEAVAKSPPPCDVCPGP